MAGSRLFAGGAMSADTTARLIAKPCVSVAMVLDMIERKSRVICVGEVLIELTRGTDGTFAPACGGDAFNAAIYLARAGLDVGFATAIGDDPYTLSLYSNNGLGRLFAALEVARAQGVKVAFDGNFRPAGWKGNLARTRTVFIEALKRVDIALPAYDDEAVLWGDPSPESTVARLQAFGIGEIVVKNGPNSALVAGAGTYEFVPVPEVVVPVDPTAAGDGFNAGYLAARLSGSDPAAAAVAAHRLAADVLRHPGPLMPRAAVAMH
jgi:sugar/nucleoside kinase (ribokinase family)